jgi:8-oxo-dGTP diphosphatase
MGTVISVYSIIENSGRILLTKDEGKPGLKLPGGKLEDGEFILDCAIREVEEETGIITGNKALVGIHEYMGTGNNHRVRIYLAATQVGGEEQRMKGEVERLAWISTNKLKDMKKEEFYLETYYLALREYLKGAKYPISLIQNL